jgi:predicted Ser/Thr protein kinase
MVSKEENKSKEVLNKLSEQGYSETASKAIRQWYNPTS